MEYTTCEANAPAENEERKNAENAPGALPNSVMLSIVKGTMAPTAAMMGQREALAPSLQEKMQGAFGMDMSNLEVYRSQTAHDAGLQGLASGNKVVLSPQIDLNSHRGQAVLGHELSHINAQAQGIGTTGRGIIETPSLERQAMVEGERAASGMRALAGSGLASFADSSAPAFSSGLGTAGEGLTPISATSGAFGMGAPMQGKWWDKPEKDPIELVDYNAARDEDMVETRNSPVPAEAAPAAAPEVPAAAPGAHKSAMKKSGGKAKRSVGFRLPKDELMPAGKQPELGDRTGNYLSVLKQRPRSVHQAAHQKKVQSNLDQRKLLKELLYKKHESDPGSLSEKEMMFFERYQRVDRLNAEMAKMRENGEL